jgi:hypothetical protein
MLAGKLPCAAQYQSNQPLDVASSESGERSEKVDGMGFEPMEPCQRLDRFTVGWFRRLTNPSTQ